jgi:hypothetical protein
MIIRAKSEEKWIAWLKAQPKPRPALQVFARNYHFFSLNQIVAFARIFQVVPATDRESLALLAAVVFDELGHGSTERVHSVIFERFAAEVGVDIATLPIASDDVVPGVRGYVEAIREGFGSALSRALATYVFLENSAVETYLPLVQALRELGVSEDGAEFFALHSELEVEHAAAARAMVERQRFDAAQQMEFDGQIAALRSHWERFWGDIHRACEDALATAG